MGKVRNRQTAYLSFLLVLILHSTWACRQKEEKPKDLWSEEKFTTVLTEVQLAEGMVRLGFHRKQDSVIPKDSIYAAVFRKMEVSEEEFDRNFNYYLDHPEDLEKIYENVITNLSQAAAKLREKKEIPPIKDTLKVQAETIKEED